MEKPVLDGKTIVRISLSFQQGGGVEQYLRDLNQSLLNRNSMTIIQMHLSKDLDHHQETTEYIGMGRFIRVAIPALFDTVSDWNSLKREKKKRGKRISHFAREHVLYNPVLGFLFSKFKRARRVRNLGIDAKNAAQIYEEIIQRYSPDLLVLHSIGSAQTAKMIDISKNRKIPFAYINHYTNQKFHDFCVREQISGASAVAGVTSAGIPKYLQKNFISVFDGIDTDFFNKDELVQKNTLSYPLILLPARVSPGKGHADLIRAAVKLKSQGVGFNLGFAGRIDSPEVLQYLKKLARISGISRRVFFLGFCDQQELRAWYARSAVVVLPSRTEGFARVLLEAQAMSRPVVAYDVGGNSQCIKNNESGFICRYGDTAKFASLLIKLLCDEGLRKKMGENGRNNVQTNYTLSHLAQRHEIFYSRIIDRPCTVE
ncbi:glycosyltransferase [Chitinispirillum alkaliphilum]|nr:glycosyltransferase [Chitinispirillum alkaliphilum]